MRSRCPLFNLLCLLIRCKYLFSCFLEYPMVCDHFSWRLPRCLSSWFKDSMFRSCSLSCSLWLVPGVLRREMSAMPIEQLRSSSPTHCLCFQSAVLMRYFDIWMHTHFHEAVGNNHRCLRTGPGNHIVCLQCRFAAITLTSSIKIYGHQGDYSNPMP